MKRSLWFTILLLIGLLVGGCSDDNELDTVNEETNPSIEEEALDEQDSTEEETDSASGLNEKPPLLEMKDGIPFVYGLKLGDAPETAEAIWGTPQIIEEEFSMDGEAYLYYPKKDMTIGYYEEKLLFIAINADEKDLHEVMENFQGDHYQNPDGDADFFYAPESGHLLIYGTANSVDGEAELRLLASDENFFYYVDEGFYVKVEE